MDVVLLLLLPLIALFLRVEQASVVNRYFGDIITYTLVSIAVRLVVFWRFKLYARYWRYASIDDLIEIASANLLSSVIIAVAFYAASAIGLITLPRSTPLIDCLIVFLVISSTRFAVRLGQRSQKQNDPSRLFNVAIMGAGDAGAVILREIQNTTQLPMKVVGFFDDDLGKHDVRIHGVPVLGGRDSIPAMVRKHRIKQVIIAMPTAPGKTIRDVVAICEEVKVDTKTMPGLFNLLDGTLSVNQLRDVEIEDLLRREPVQTDIEAVQALIEDACVLVTGGGGSIGSELCRQIWRCGPRQLVLVGHGENSIFAIHNELRDTGRKQGVEDVDSKIKAVLVDTRFSHRVEQILLRYRPKIVFHAAAHKHVPLMEMNPAEAITNNVLGTRNILNASLKANVPHFVMISTDKAVNPTNVMGASKRVAELLVHQAAKDSGNAYVAVRFGNVLGSRGSVIHTFKRQIANGGPVTVTHPEMVRFFMTIPEAVQLVLQASVLGDGGQVFVLDMGQPVKIMDLAQDLITLSGFEVGRDIDIKVSGIRPGEKLYEELFIEGEAYGRTRHQKIFIASNASSLVPTSLENKIDELMIAADADNRTAIMHSLKNLIPEFKPTGFTFDKAYKFVHDTPESNGFLKKIRGA